MEGESNITGCEPISKIIDICDIMNALPSKEECVEKTACVKNLPAASCHVEIHMKPRLQKSNYEEVCSSVHELLLKKIWVYNEYPCAKSDELDGLVESIIVYCSHLSRGCMFEVTCKSLPIENVHAYRPVGLDPEPFELSLDNSSESSLAGVIYQLPCAEFDQQWERLVYEDDIKHELLSYVNALAQLAKKGADPSVLRINRMILLHGPPGTGKTSLCKGLAQKLSIYLNRKYKKTLLVEINSHSLFSKWYSESGKMVQRMFEQIEELVLNKETLVLVLIDEVESLTMERRGLVKAYEPSDGVRVVNAILTQIDHLRRRNNVLIFTTSNIAESLDNAFTDRADINRYVSAPTNSAIRSIFDSCIQELQRIGIVDSYINETDAIDRYERKFDEIVTKASGMSGRTLRQIPVLAYSKLILEKMSVDECLDLFDLVISEKIAAKNK